MNRIMRDALLMLMLLGCLEAVSGFVRNWSNNENDLDAFDNDHCMLLFYNIQDFQGRHNIVAKDKERLRGKQKSVRSIGK